MSTSEKIRELLLQGVPPQEIVKMGFPKSTVYYVAKKLAQQLLGAIEELMSVGEGCRKVGSYMVSGVPGGVIVMRLSEGRNLFDFLKEFARLKDGECRVGTYIVCREGAETLVYNAWRENAGVAKIASVVVNKDSEEGDQR